MSSFFIARPVPADIQERLRKRNLRRKHPKVYHTPCLKKDGSRGWSGGPALKSSAAYTASFCRAIFYVWWKLYDGAVPPGSDVSMSSSTASSSSSSSSSDWSRWWSRPAVSPEIVLPCFTNFYHVLPLSAVVNFHQLSSYVIALWDIGCVALPGHARPPSFLDRDGLRRLINSRDVSAKLGVCDLATGGKKTTA